LFFLYMALAGGGAWSLDRLRRPKGEAESESRWAPYALAVLRIVAGFLFIFHGIDKVTGRVPLDLTSLRAFAAALEFVGGPLLMAGLFTRPVAFILSGEMAFAYFINHWPERFWGSFVEPNQEAAILNSFLFLFLWGAGPGAWSLDGAWRPAGRTQPAARVQPAG
jgi:putative oxidoreductase